MAGSRERRADCPLCDGTEARHLVTKRGCEVVRCTGCGLVFVWPQPMAASLDALYSGGVYHAAFDEAERRRTFARRLRQIEGLSPRRGRILDVGCSKGHFLDVARGEGWDAVGVELNRNAVEEARARGLDVRDGELAAGGAKVASALGLEDASFDVATLFDVIEHTRDPRATLAACRRLLRPGGLLIVTTPDISGLVPRLTYVLFATILGAWDHPTPPGHLFQFSRATLRQMLEKEGFEVVGQRSEHIPVAYSVGKLENSILDVLAGRHKTRPAPTLTPPLAAPGAEAAPRRGLSPCSLVRLGVRAMGWLTVGAAGLAARATGWGDSMLVTARRPADGSAPPSLHCGSTVSL